MTQSVTPTVIPAETPTWDSKCSLRAGRLWRQCVVVFFCGVFIPRCCCLKITKNTKTKKKKNLAVCCVGLDSRIWPLASRGPVPGYGRKRPHSTFLVKTSSLYFVCLCDLAIETSHTSQSVRPNNGMIFFFSLFVRSPPKTLLKANCRRLACSTR